MNKLCALIITLISALPCVGQAAHSAALTPQQADEIVGHLISSLNDYVFPEIAEKLQAQIRAHRSEYRAIPDPDALAAKLTEDLRAVAHDHHLAVTVGEELAEFKAPTAAEEEHSHAFDLAKGCGIRSARRLPGNIGYLDLAYFSPDSDVGAAYAAAMQLVSGTDALIVDLRRNGGGSGDAVTALLSYFFDDPVQITSKMERKNGQFSERQKWTMPYVAGPRYSEKPVFVLSSTHTHSAAEQCAYDFKNTHRAVIVGEHTAGDANGSSGEIVLGYRFSAFIPDSQPRSPVTHGNWQGTGVQSDVATSAPDALISAYKLALKNSKPGLQSEELSKERELAIQDPESALAEEIAGFEKK